METDWREILKFSQRELKQGEKEKLCESLSWMEADDIELNFTDLKILFRLAQDLIKYKTEQVNGVLGKLEKTKRKIKTKERSTFTDSPAISSDSVLETITHQEEVIKANKDILEQLYADIAELEERKTQHEKDKNKDQESESSRGTLSELNAVAQLENEVAKRNKHIRKLLGDVKILEEENTTIKEKLIIFKDKLKEATLLIENLSEQLFTFNNEQTNLKELLARMEEEKANLVLEIDNLQNERNKINLLYEKTEENVKSEHHRLKDILKRHKSKIDELSAENSQLKEDMIQKSKMNISPKKIKIEEMKIKELQEKLLEASEEMIKSANLIHTLKEENQRLKVVIEDVPDVSVSEHKNESDDGKEKNIINKLKKKVKSLKLTLHGTEEMVAVREKELAEITAQLKILRSDDGINALIEGIQNKKRHLKIKDEGIKSLVQEVNLLNSLVSKFQLENETMRNRLEIPENEEIYTHGILKNYKDLEISNVQLKNKLQEYENKLVSLEIECYNKKTELQQLRLNLKTYDENNLNDFNSVNKTSDLMKTILEENEGLRKGLTEILTYLKDNSNTTSGILSMECPSLEAILNSMEARKLAGWFSPHMTTIMELKAAKGGKEALISALNDSRTETFQLMEKLSEEKKKSSDLEKVILGIKEKTQVKPEVDEKLLFCTDMTLGEFGSWMSNNTLGKIDFSDGYQIKDLLNKGNVLFENQFIHALQYFQNKFTMLFDKLTSLTISAEDDLNRWLLKEEQYKAEIEYLKCQIDENEDDTSNRSPGLLSTSKLNLMDRKYSFLEDSFKQIRTLNENIKNEHLEIKKEKMIETFEYEKKVQSLLISVLNLSDKLRNSIPLELFLKQNEILNQYILKYRNVIENNNRTHIKSLDITKRLDDDKIDVINRFHKLIKDKSITGVQQSNKILSDVEQIVLQKQLEQMSLELNKRNSEIEILERKVLDLQTSQSILIDKTMSKEANEDTNIDQIKLLQEENKFLKDQQKEIQNKYDILLSQVKANEKRKLNNDIEINMLRHQVLDLQSTGDNKAIIARLSGEVLLAHVQTSESNDKIESLKIDLHKEKQMRAEAEEMLNKREKVFDIYSKRCNKQLRSMSDIVEVLRNQYNGCLPLICAETFYHKLEELQRKSQETQEKLNDLEDLQSNLMTKHSIYNQILDLSNTKCFDDEDSCHHKLQNIVMENTQKLELENYNKKIAVLEQSHKNLLERCNLLEKSLLLVNQVFKQSSSKYENSVCQKENEELKVQDIQTSDETNSKGSLTYTILHEKPQNYNTEASRIKQIDDAKLNKTVIETKKVEHRQTQTHLFSRPTDVKKIQTDDDENSIELNTHVNKLLKDNKHKDKLLEDLNSMSRRQTQELSLLNTEKSELNNKLQNVIGTIREKDKIIKQLEAVIDFTKKEIHEFKLKEISQVNANEAITTENQDLIENLKKIESDKNNVIVEYKELLKKERQEYLKSIKKLQSDLSDLQAVVDEKQFKTTSPKNDISNEVTSKYRIKINDLEDKCFKFQSAVEGYKTDLKNQQSELERWKELALERLSKMEQLSTQLKERHNHEMESYKAENQHWMTQLNETQREHMELRTRLAEQKALHVKQLTEKDAQIENLRSVINNLKTQILNMQTMLTTNDPSFDLSAIVEVEELSDAASQLGSDRLELKFESTGDLNEMQDDFVRISSTSTAIWQEPMIERLRREKQLIGKQNTILRRQIKVLAARERRSRLDAQNLKNQVFRITTTGNKVPSAESAALQNKIASLQAQLTSARRDAHSSVALWDKWKRAQQLSERWQAKYDEKCQEMKKLEVSLNLSKSAIARLEKEKRTLFIRLGDIKHEKTLDIEKQDAETSEKVLSKDEDSFTPPPVSTRALLGRIEAQQRRIAALELAEKGNETLVSEYEKCLAEITSLKGQVLKLESTLLEAQIRSPINSACDTKPELDYWKNYCDMLKEENMQLTLRVNCLENIPTSANQQRVSDLEQTVLTLRGLVSKLQADQKSGANKRVDSRPSSGRSSSEKIRTQVESYRIEISNLKKTILEKDALLENSKEMLRIAAEREDELLRENTRLQRRLEQIEMRGGLMSA